MVRPLSTAERAMGRDRNRSRIPLLRSSVMPMAVLAVRGSAGERYRAAEHEREKQHEHDRLQDGEQRELRNARNAFEVAPRDDHPVAQRLFHLALTEAAGESCGGAISAAWPVSVRKTSSSVGRRKAMSSIVICASS